ncbi:hypothetical protein ACF3OC_12815 [Sphingobacterium cellulitidis]|uniref:hypothetical protein n=1 Tax=Sphingobacterium cellulitidis TaxID=1768011 RepID=UPI00370D6DC2
MLVTTSWNLVVNGSNYSGEIEGRTTSENFSFKTVIERNDTMLKNVENYSNYSCRKSQ